MNSITRGLNIQRCSSMTVRGSGRPCFSRDARELLLVPESESQSAGPEILLDRRKCNPLRACHRVCPNGAVRLEEGKRSSTGRLAALRTMCGFLPNEARSISGSPMRWTRFFGKFSGM